MHQQSNVFQLQSTVPDVFGEKGLEYLEDLLGIQTPWRLPEDGLLEDNAQFTWFWA